MFPQRVAVKDMNPHLMCTLCGGYFIDATTITECLHSFCKSCIVKHLATSKYCPTCEVQVHKTRPLENVRPDHILQAIVYKLVPGLYQNEMKSRREFYRKHQEDVPVSLEAKGELSEECGIFFPEESIMLSLEYNSENSETCQISCSRRYLQCPAAITINHLQKLIRSKFGLTPNCKVDFFCTNVLLPEFLTLLDIAYIFKWRRKTVLHLSYHILESKSQIVEPKKEETEESTNCEEIANSMEVDQTIVSETAPEATAKTESNWQEVQLQISENGVVSAATPSSSTSQENIVNKINFEAKMEGPKPVASNDDQMSQVNSNKLEVGVKENHVESAPKSESKKESVEVTPVAKEPSKVNSIDNSAVQKTSVSNDAKNTASSESVAAQKATVSSDVKKAEPKESVAAKTESSSSPKEVDTAPKVQSEVCKSNVAKSKPKEAAQSKEESDEPKVKSNAETNVKPKSVWNPSQTPDSTKKVCKVEPSLMGLPCGLSITQRPALKTYPGLKPINTGKDSGIKGIAGLSKEVSIKPIVSVSTSAAVLPNKTDVSCSSKISSTTTPIVPPSLSKKPTPIRYKTLKSPTKPWNPSIPRSSMLMMKQNNNEKDSDQLKNIQPPKFFKTRNVPRYLGNPASGVKPMYQTSESSSANSETVKSKGLDMNAQRSCSSSVTLMKIDPKTLSPIVVSSAPSSPSPNPNFTVAPHLKKPSLPPPRGMGSPKQSPILKSKPVVTNKTLAHSTSLPSPAHSRSLLATNPFFNAANPLLYPGFPHPFAHAESTKRALAGAANSSNLIRAMSSLCSPTAAFHPSLPPSLSLLFNAHQVGFPRLSSSTNKAALKTLGSPELSPPIPVPVSVATPSSHTHIPSKPKKPVTAPFLDSSRYGMLCTNGILPYPAEGQNSVSSSVESPFKSKSNSKPSCPVQRTDQVEKMDVDSPKRDAKSISVDCIKKTLINSNKRLKRDDPIESNVNFKEDKIMGSKKPTEATEASSSAKKDSSCDIKSKPSSVSQPDKISENRSKLISSEVSCSKQNETDSGSSNGNINDSVSTKSVMKKDSPVSKKDESVIESNQCDNKVSDFSNSSSKTSSKQVEKVSETDVRLNAINNNNETSSTGTKDIPNVVSADSVPQVN